MCDRLMVDSIVCMTAIAAVGQAQILPHSNGFLPASHATTAWHKVFQFKPYLCRSGQWCIEEVV